MARLMLRTWPVPCLTVVVTIGLWLIVAPLAGCGRDALDREALVDPAGCVGCHADHVREWSGSMHAYASDDPVFQAMNRLGQRATGGALGDFCVGCHAPVAVAAGLTGGTGDLTGVPRELRGVTCIACHQVAEVVTLHNGGLTWANDDVMFGGLADPEDTGAHRSAYSPLVDGNQVGSSDMCGACHDVRVGEVAIESTHAEWSTSVFADPVTGVSCSGCHLPGRDGVAALGGPSRRVHDHTMGGVDLPLTPWPEREAQERAIARDLAGVLAARLCVYPTGGGVRVEVLLDNILSGHAFPSGVTHARRAWVEVLAEEAGAVTFERGRFAADAVITPYGPEDDTWIMTSRFLGTDGEEVAQAWEAKSIESSLLTPAVTRDPGDPRYYHAQTRTWFVAGLPDRVEMVVRLEAIGLDVIDSLIAAGELDPAVRTQIARHELRGTRREWVRGRDDVCVP
jgi:hypothetical protein